MRLPHNKTRGIAISVGVAATGYLGFVIWAGWHEVIAALRGISTGLLLLLLLLSLINYGLRFIRWQLYLRRFGRRIKTTSSLAIYLAGFSLTTTPGKAGEAVRSLFLKRHGMPVSESIAAFFAERLSDLIAVLLLVAIGISIYPDARPLTVGLGIAVVALLLGLHSRRFIDYMNSRIHRWLPRRVALAGDHLFEALRQTGRCLEWLPLLGGLVLALVAWGAEGLGVYLLANALGFNLPLMDALFIYALALLVGAVSFLPGGLGSTELTMVILLLLYQIPEPAAASLTILVRVATLWFAVALGIIALAGLEKLPTVGEE